MIASCDCGVPWGVLWSSMKARKWGVVRWREGGRCYGRSISVHVSFQYEMSSGFSQLGILYFMGYVIDRGKEDRKPCRARLWDMGFFSS